MPSGIETLHESPAPRPEQKSRIPKWIQMFAASVAAVIAQGEMPRATAEKPVPLANDQEPAFTYEWYARTDKKQGGNQWNERLLRKPFGNMPAAKRIDMHLYQNSRRAVIVLRQLHWNKNLNGLERNEVTRCQVELREALLWLLQNNIADTVFNEGFVVHNTPELHRMTHREYVGEDVSGKTALSTWGASDVLAFQKKITLRPAEDYLRYIAAAPTSLGIPNQEPREQFVIDHIGETPTELMPILVFGASHDWEDNIRLYNEQHPDDPLSLIEITLGEVERKGVKRFDFDNRTIDQKFFYVVRANSAQARSLLPSAADDSAQSTGRLQQVLSH